MMDFTNLVQVIIDIHKQTHTHAAKAVNSALTLRNWLIGTATNRKHVSVPLPLCFRTVAIPQNSKFFSR